MKFLIVLLCLTVTVLAALEQDKEQWTNFKNKHGKIYKNFQEEKKRFSIFQQNLRAIEEHNKQFKAGNTTYTKGVNHFTDLTKEEFVSFLNRRSAGHPKSNTIYEKPIGLTVPNAIDWRDQGAISPVKSQGECGACWAFATTGVLESYYYLKNNQNISLSEQQLIDCDENDDGCDGGDEGVGLEYVKKAGIETEGDYEYQEKDGTCQYNTDTIVDLTIDEVIQLEKKNEGNMLDVLGSIGPFTVALDANNLDSYSSGVFTDASCSKTDLNHAVLAVGYGHDDDTGLDYWLIKNSWSTGWGEEGFFKIRRGTDECGISTECHYVTLK